MSLHPSEIVDIAPHRPPMLAILGCGTALPEQAIAQDDAARLAAEWLGPVAARQGHLLPALYRRAGVRRRHSVLLAPPGAPRRQDFYPAATKEDDHGPTTAERMAAYARHIGPLAAQAARAALADAAIDARRVTHLVTASCTGFCAPGVDIQLIDALGLVPTVQRVHIGFMGCHGAINGLRAAAAFAAGGGPDACVLFCAAELCSLHFQYGADAEKMVANALFADGAAALVGAPALDAAARHLATPPVAPAADPWRLVASGSCLVPASADAMTWTIGDHGFEMTLAPRVPDLIERHLRDWLEAWLAELGYELGDMGSWAVHPGGPRILAAVERALDLPPEATAPSRAVLADCGNMSSPTILFILRRLMRAAAPRPCLALAFGPGLIAEAALFA